MTQFQLISVVIFAVVVVAAYGKDVLERVKAMLKSVTKAKPAARDSSTEEMVDDLVAVAALRDKLDEQGCKDGVDACTILLRILVEFRPPDEG